MRPSVAPGDEARAWYIDGEGKYFMMASPWLEHAVTVVKLWRINGENNNGVRPGDSRSNLMKFEFHLFSSRSHRI